MNRFYHVESYGALWRVSKRMYERLLEAIIRKEEIDLDKYGQRIGVIDMNLTAVQDEQQQWSEGYKTTAVEKLEGLRAGEV